MEKFFIGLDHPSECWPFRNCMVSVNALKGRKSGFRVNDWIMDSGAFTQISKHGKFTMSPDEYLEHIDRFSGCGNLLAACAQDWMCEPFILETTGKTVEEHQELTLQSFNELQQWTDTAILPVLQGFESKEYAAHVRMYGDYLKEGQWVGVGSVCKRNGNPDAVEDVLLAIKSERSDLRLHGFGLKKQALDRGTVRELLYSSDSMAWNYAGRRENNKHDPRRALAYAAHIESIIKRPGFVQQQLFDWWNMVDPWDQQMYGPFQNFIKAWN